MENGVNDDDRPLPSTPNTTGLAWNKPTSLFVNTGDLSPVTVGMFLSLATEGDNTTSTNGSVSIAPQDKEQRSPPKACPSVGVGKSIDPTKSKTKNNLKPCRPNFNWKTAQSLNFENLEKAQQAFITTNYQLLRKRSLKLNARYLPKGTTHEYQCFVAKTQQGFCCAYIEERIGQCFALKVSIVGACACGGDKTHNGRGLSPQDALVLNSVMKDNPKLKPKAMAGEVLKALVQEESPSVSSPELRSMLANKLKNKIKHQFIRERMLGTRSSNLEDNLKQWESSLFDEGYLRVAPCEWISNCCSQAYNSMTILHSSNFMPPNNASNSEKNIYAHLQKLQGQSKKSDDQVWDKIVCFSSLSLLYNVVRCRTLRYQVTASADGFHGTCSNDWHILTFGVFAPKEDGSQSYHPFLFILCTSKKEIYFTAGLLVLLRFIDGLFANGDYSTHSVDKKWLQGSAARDVQSLYQCISKPMFDTLAKVTKQSWLACGEKRLVEGFFKSYIDRQYFNMWYVGSLGIAGCIPQNQANERATLELKGTSKFDGLCAIGKSIGSMLTEELPKAIYMMSLQQTSLCCTFPILNRNQIFNKKSNFYTKFSQYCSLVDKQINIQTITEGTPIWYLNSKDSLGKMVIATQVETYEKSVGGTNSHLLCIPNDIFTLTRFTVYANRPRRTKIGPGVGYKGEFIQLLNQTGTNMHNATKCLINDSVKNSVMCSIANNPAISTLVVKFNIRQRNNLLLTSTCHWPKKP
eukprot:jgi/Psemu1/38820/gm1.38820_g